MEDSTDEYNNREEENTSRSFEDTSSEIAHVKSTEDASVDSITDEQVADIDNIAFDEQSNDSSSSTPTPFENEDSVPAYDQSNNSPSAQVEYIPLPEHSPGSSPAVEKRNSPQWPEHSSNLTASDDSNVNDSKNESDEKMETESTFQVETSPSKKEIRIDMKPLTESELIRLGNVSDSEVSDEEESKDDSQKSPTNSSKMNCTDDDGSSLDADISNVKISINEDSLQSEDFDEEKRGEDESKPEKTLHMSVDEDDDGTDLLSKVNTNLPNTELSNADLSALEVAQPSEKLSHAQNTSMETDLLDELSDFCGFEERSVQESLKALQILRAERDQLLRAARNELLNEFADDTTDNEEAATVTSESRNDGGGESASSRRPAAESSSSTPAMAGAVEPRTAAMTTLQSPATPVTPAAATAGAPIFTESHTIFHKSTGSYVYALAKDVNIFEEKVPSGSKRVKKKQKFFGFDEPVGGAAKRTPTTPQPPKEPENTARMAENTARVAENTARVAENTARIENNIFSENKENFMTADKQKEEPASPIVEPLVEPVLPSPVPPPPSVPKTQPKPPPPTPPSSMPSKIPVKAKRSAFDVSKPLYKEPFKHGWRREIFYRDLPEGSKSKTAYISYFNEQNKKFKTIRQIVEHLPPGAELNEKNFTFSKERIFRDNEPGCEHEIVRYQKDITKELNNSSTTTSAMSLLKRLKKIGDGTPSPIQDPTKSKSIGKPKMKGDESDDEDMNSPSSAISKMAMPKILIRGVGPNSAKTPSIKSKLSSSKSSSGQKKVSKSSKKPFEKSSKPRPSINEDGDGASSDYDDESMSYALGSAGASLATPNQKNARETPTCSMSCPLALGHPPTLQCVNCLGLFHFQCCGFDTSRPISDFLCQKCRHPQMSADGGEPFGGYASTRFVGAAGATAAAADAAILQAQRFGGPPADDRLAGAPWLPPPAALAAGGAAVPKIVDGVTTWLPSSSNIHLSSAAAKAAQLYSGDGLPNGERDASLLQSVLELEGRRYIIVPKESIVSISPNAKDSAAAAAAAAAATAAYTGASAEYEHQLRQQQFVRELHGERVDDAGRQYAASTEGVSNATSSIPNSAFLVNPNNNNYNHNNNNNHHHHYSNVNSTGVLLVPVMPSGGTGARPAAQYYARDARGGHVGYAACDVNAYGSHSLKRKHSNESDSSIRRAKMARLDVDAEHHIPYRSSLTLSNMSLLYEPLILCFKYLTVKELLRVSMSCKYLNRLASDSALWSTVRLKNSKITDWDGFARTLRKHRTKRLDMWKMLSPTAPEDISAMWDDFCRVIPSITSLERIDLMRCPSKVVQTAAENCHNLTVINALQLNKNGSLSLSSFTKLKYLRELRLKGFPSISLEPSDRLKFVRTDSLQVLSLTNVKNLNMNTLEAISRLNHLRVLELGECESLSHNFTDILSNLKRLERLRLEKVVNLEPDYRMFALLKDLRHFRSLELINFEVKIGFDEAVAHCRNLEEFLLIPLYKTQSATANKVIVNGIQKLAGTLKKFVWGLTTELLKVTDIFVQEYQMKAASKTAAAGGALETSSNGNKVVARKGQPDSIPILKHLSEHLDNPEVDILTIAQLEKMLVSLLPAARVKVLKIPFNTTGRQSLSDCFK